MKLGFDVGVHQVRTSNQLGGKIGILGGEGAPIDYHLHLLITYQKKRLC